MAHLVKCCLLVLLAFFITFVPGNAKGNDPGLRRQKREWIIAPRKLKENNDYTGYEYIARIRSDKENYTKIIYSLSGPGVDQPPVGVFGVNPNNGYVKIYSILDREKIAFYHLKGVAQFINGSFAEKDIDLRITVVDENDCPPVIKVGQVGNVSEGSAAGTVVMKVIATDDDEKGSLNSQIHYSIVEQSNHGGMFFINSQTGQVMVQKTTLDRETKDTYRLIIKASDLNGQPGGNTGTGEIVIKLNDINDNVPTLEKESYEGSVEENTINKEVLRVKAIDMDVIHTDNWLAVYEIVSGNEAGYFTITTDSKTNEGIIMINKPIDYEKLKVLNLELAVRNKAEYNFGSGGITGATGSKSYPIKINVINQKEGPRFQPNVKVVTLSEDHSTTSLHKVITTYAAIDSDTLKTATNVRYAKIRDDDNWLIIDEKTADIRLNKLPDRESKFLINGTYYAEIICITNEVPSKTATGTIAIQVEDFNDHCPELIATSQTMCLEDQVIYASAVDKDEFPNSAPFEYTVIEEKSIGKWKVENLNETTVILRDHADLWPGIYKVTVEIKDQQGKVCAADQTIDVTVCTCEENTKTCSSRRTKTVGLGAWGVLLLLLGLLLLLLIPLLLLFCLCGGAAALGDFKAIPFDAKQQLISYHTEGQGEDKELPLLLEGGTLLTKDVNTVTGKGFQGLAESGGMALGGGAFGGGLKSSTWAENMDQYNRYSHYSGQGSMGYMHGGAMMGQDHYYSQKSAGVFDGLALSDQFLKEYYTSKSNHTAQQSQQKDGFLVYDYEGQESLAGSVGCCSLLENDDDLSFLNDLGPKFKTLAAICQGSTFETDSVDVGVSVIPPRPVSPIKPSTSTHTHVHTHTETVRDRDRVSSNMVNTSNVSSGSSTVIKEERITERAQSSAAVPKVHVQDNIVIPTQTLLIQQPAMYYAAAPMYVVDPKPQVVLVAGDTQQAVGQVAPVGLSQGVVQVGALQGSQVGLSQGVVQVGALQGSQVGLSQGVVQVGALQGSQVGLSQGVVQVGGLQGSQGVVLVDKQIGMGAAAAGQVVQGVSQGASSSSRSRQVIVVENGSTGRQQGAHHQYGLIQTGQGPAVQGMEVRGQGVQVKSQSFSVGSATSAGSNEDFALTATPKVQGSQRVVVQHKKVSVTERNVESSTRA